jgi:hypothetical protein
MKEFIFLYLHDSELYVGISVSMLLTNLRAFYSMNDIFMLVICVCFIKDSKNVSLTHHFKLFEITYANKIPPFYTFDQLV